MQINLLKGKVAINNLNMSKLAEAIGLNRDTLYRRMRNDGERLSIGNIKKMRSVLNLSDTDIINIFFKP